MEGARDDDLKRVRALHTNSHLVVLIVSCPPTINLPNTSFDSSLPREVNRRFSPERTSRPSRTSSAIVASKLSRGAPNSSRNRPISTPRLSLSPKKKLSSKACCWLTAEALKSAATKKRSYSSVVANLTLSTPCSAAGSIECASTPKPRYGCRVQYFKLCRDSNPGRAKLEISYCSIPAAFNCSHAVS